MPGSAQALRARWQTLAPRERSLVLAAAALLGLALAWWLLLAPALATARQSAARHAELDARLQRMQELQAEAERLKAAPRAQGGGDPQTALRASVTQHLGESARITVVGDRATITLKAAPAEALAQWLAQARAAARAAPVQAQLTRSPSAPASAAWDGTVVLALPTE